MKRWARWVVLPVVGFTFATAGSCQGTVVERVWKHNLVGADTCNLKIEPDKDQDGTRGKSYVVRNRSNRDCNNCPEGARWPDCKDANEKSKKREEEPRGHYGQAVEARKVGSVPNAQESGKHAVGVAPGTKAQQANPKPGSSHDNKTAQDHNHQGKHRAE